MDDLCWYLSAEEPTRVFESPERYARCRLPKRERIFRPSRLTVDHEFWDRETESQKPAHHYDDKPNRTGIRNQCKAIKNTTEANEETAQ
jgi:hypothetical protein